MSENMNENQEMTAPEAPATETVEKKKSKKPLIIVIVLLVIAAIAAGAFWFMSQSTQPKTSTTGVEIVDGSGMSDEEIQSMLDEMARESMMEVSLSDRLKLDGNELTINFTNAPDNKNAQVFQVVQDGDAIYISDPIEPGYAAKTVTLSPIQAGKLHNGAASVLVSYANEKGELVGNGASVDVTIVKAER